MGIIDRVTTFVTGKNKAERSADRVANRIIRQKSNAAYRKAKLIEAEKFAEARARHEYSQKMERLKHPQKYNILGGGYSSPIGDSPFLNHSKPGKDKRTFDVLSGGWR